MKKNTNRVAKLLVTTAEDGRISVASDTGTSMVCSEDTQQKEQTKFISVKEACEITGLSRWTISDMLRQKDEKGNYLIIWIKFGKAQSSPVRIDKASFMAYLESMTAHPEEEVVKS